MLEKHKMCEKTWRQLKKFTVGCNLTDVFNNKTNLFIELILLRRIIYLFSERMSKL